MIISAKKCYGENRGSTTCGIAEAFSKAHSGDVIIVEECFPRQCVYVTTQALGITLVVKGTITCALGTDHGIYVSSPGLRIIGTPGVATVAGSYLSGIFVASGANGFVCQDVTVSDYNRSGKQPHAGLFLMASGPSIPIRRVAVERFIALGGNGNGLRIGGVVGGQFRDCQVENTTGLSAEGVTVVGSDLLLERVCVKRALTTGILVWGSSAMRNVRLVRCEVSNSSQAVLAPPAGISQQGSNFAFEVDAQGSVLTDVTFQDCVAYDDQVDSTGSPAPTQEGFLSVRNSSLKGKVINLVVNRWNESGNILSAPNPNAAPISYAFDDQASELVNPKIIPGPCEW